MSQGKRDTWGSNSYRGSLALFARYPQSSALEIPGGHEVVYDISFMKCSIKASISSQLEIIVNQTFPIWSRQEGEVVSLQGLSFEGSRQTSRRLRGLTDPRHLDALPLILPLLPPTHPKHPSAPPEWVTSCGCLWGCVRALYR